MNSAFVLVLFFSIAGLYILAALAALVFKQREKAGNWISSLISAAASAAGIYLSVSLLIGWIGQTAEAFLNTAFPMIRLAVRIDGMSAFFLLALSVLSLSTSIYGIGYCRHYMGKKPVWLLNCLTPLFVCSMMFVMVAGDAVLFLLAWEIMSLVSYFLVMFEHEQQETQRAGTIYIIMTHAGTAFLFIAFFLMYVQTGTFDFAGWRETGIQVGSLVFILLLIGFGTKAGIVPLHIWLPEAHPAAPGHISALMSGIMLKTAIYGLVRFLFEILGIREAWWGIVLILVGAVSAVIGIAYGYVESNIKRLLAFSSIENIGIIFMGLGLSALASAGDRLELALFALMAAMLHTFNHTLFKGLMFLNAGSVHFAVHTKNIEELGGLIKRMPWTGLFTLIGSLALSAIVPLNGFVGEWLIYQSFFQNLLVSSPLASLALILGAAALAFAGALAAGTFVKLIGVAFLGRARTVKAEAAVEVPVSMLLAKGMLALLCVLIGIFPLLLITMIQNAFQPIWGVAVTNRLQGFSSFLYLPVITPAKSGSIMPVAILAGLVLIAALALLVSRILGGKLKIRRNGTWDCGYKGLTSKMQYSARGFANPMKIILKALYRPQVQITHENDGQPYNPGSIRYELRTEKIIEKHLYRPLVRVINQLAGWVQLRFHTGSVHMYLIYIFVVMVLLMLYTRLFGSVN